MSTVPLVSRRIFRCTFPYMVSTNGRRGVVTPENKEESARLKKLWDAYRATDHSLSQVDFGKDFGIGSQSAVTNMLNGHMAISLNAAKAFAKGLGVEVRSFSPRLAAVIDDLTPSEWPLGDEVTPAIWADLDDKIKTKIRNNAEYIVREYREKLGKIRYLPTGRKTKEVQLNGPARIYKLSEYRSP